MNYFKQLFKKKNYNIGIIKFGDNIVIPGRDYFKDEKDIELLEEYKKHYIEEICKRNAVTTLNFNSNTLKQDMNMNVDLILKLLLDNEDFYLLAPEELIIQSLKLKMYYEEISALEKETILRLIALKEIEKSKRVPRHNRITLEEEINQLSIILDMYSYRKTAINIELKNYFDVLSTKDLSKEDTEIFKQRLAKLLFITGGIIDKQEIDKYEDIKIKIAVLERECERYAYQNKEEACELKKSYDLSDENKILLFYEYGKNCFDESFIKDLYIYKFIMLTCNINNESLISPINKDDYGFSYYEDIISNEIQTMQSSFYFSHLVGDEIDIKSLLEDARRYLKNEYGEFDYADILTNKLKLAFIMSMHYINLDYFFNENIVNPNEPNGYEEIIHSRSSGITWHNSVPLASIFEVASDSSTNHPLYSFYKLNRIKTNLLIPEGVKTVDLNKISIYKSRYGKHRLPKTVKSICGHLKYDDYYNIYHELELNDGLEFIGSDVFGSELSKISIPSSVKEISLIGNTNVCNTDCIEFRDFKNSEVLNNEQKFLEFIRLCSKVDTHKRKLHIPSEYNLKIQERYRKDGFSTSNHAALYDREYTIYIYELRMLFSTMVFTSDDIVKPITISAADLKIFFDKEDRIGTHNYIGSPNYYEVYLKIREIIKEQTGYDIFEKAQVKIKK